MARTALLAMAVKSPPTMEAHATASRTTQGQQHIKQLLVKALRWELDPLQARRKQQSGKSIQLVKGRPVSSTRRDRPFSFRQLPPLGTVQKTGVFSVVTKWLRSRRPHAAATGNT